MLTDIKIKRVYDSENDNLLEDFYIPILKQSIRYKRVTGFFSSTSLIIAAQGISHFYSNNGIYQLISGVVLSDKDYQAFINGTQQLSESLIDKLAINPQDLSDEIQKDHLKIISWLIAEKKLKIKIAVLPDSNLGIFHEKIGIFEDEIGNKVSFSGSVNESGNGWLNNIEEFKVFRNWIESENEYLINDCEKFESYWGNNTKNFKVLDLPEAIEKQILQIKPNEKEIIHIIKKLNTNINMNKVSLRPYQIEAIDLWKKNNFKGIFEMATGTGKTLTSLGAVEDIYKLKNEYCTVIVVPYKHLVTQWIKDIKKQLNGAQIVEAHSDSSGWKIKLQQYLGDYEDGFINKLVIITLYDTVSSSDFINIFNKKYNKDKEYILIADEVHNFGAPKYSKGMLINIEKRVGLSATPTRWFDEQGTQNIIDYFDKSIFKYDMKTAIANKILTPYDYFPTFVQMSGAEFEEYMELSKKIVKLKHNINLDEYVKLLTLKRSKIIRNTLDKLNTFNQLIKKLNKENDIDHLLIYCDSGGQLIKAQEVVNELGIVNHKFTEKESVEERDRILREFDRGTYDCLVAVKCLDEGVDIPSIRTAIILASSTNPREYIQRRGRVLRYYPGKEKATIYDFIVLPPNTLDNSVLSTIERKILKKELNRVQEFLDTANNKASILNQLTDIMSSYKVYLD